MRIFRKKEINLFKVLTIQLILVSFISTSILPLSMVQAWSVTELAKPGTLVGLSQAYVPALIKGLTLHPDNPYKFDFLIDSGDEKHEGEALSTEAEKLVKYFLASLTVPEDEMWVNLSPYEKDRIIPEGFGQTEMGRDLLAQDYLLKQLTASLVYPEEELGQEFWKRVHKKAKAQYGTTEISLNTFNKVWIVPEKASVYINENNVFVADSSLKVLLENDYRAMAFHQKATAQSRAPARDMAHKDSKIQSQIIKEIIIPEIEREVNEGKHFAPLRQIYQSMILATWYKTNLKKSILNEIYADKNRTKGVDHDDKQVTQEIYKRYTEAFKKGVYNYIKEDIDPKTQETIPRKYFSGGVNLDINVEPTTSPTRAQRKNLSGIRGALVKLSIALSLCTASGCSLFDPTPDPLTAKVLQEVEAPVPKPKKDKAMISPLMNAQVGDILTLREKSTNMDVQYTVLDIEIRKITEYEGGHVKVVLRVRDRDEQGDEFALKYDNLSKEQKIVEDIRGDHLVSYNVLEDEAGNPVLRSDWLKLPSQFSPDRQGIEKRIKSLSDYLAAHTRYRNYQYLWLKLLQDSITALDELEAAGYYYNDDLHNLWITTDQSGVVKGILGDFGLVVAGTSKNGRIKELKILEILDIFRLYSPSQDGHDEIRIQSVIDQVGPLVDNLDESDAQIFDEAAFAQLRASIAEALEDFDVYKLLSQIYDQNEKRNQAMLSILDAQPGDKVYLQHMTTGEEAIYEVLEIVEKGSDLEPNEDLNIRKVRDDKGNEFAIKYDEYTSEYEYVEQIRGEHLLSYEPLIDALGVSVVSSEWLKLPNKFDPGWDGDADSLIYKYLYLESHRKYPNYKYLWLKFLSDSFAALDELAAAGYYYDDDLEQNIWIRADGRGIAQAVLGDFGDLQPISAENSHLREGRILELIYSFRSNAPTLDSDEDTEIGPILKLIKHLSTPEDEYSEDEVIFDNEAYARLRALVDETMSRLEVEDRLAKIYSQNDPINQAMLALVETKPGDTIILYNPSTGQDEQYTIIEDVERGSTNVLLRAKDEKGAEYALKQKEGSEEHLYVEKIRGDHLLAYHVLDDVYGSPVLISKWLEMPNKFHPDSNEKTHAIPYIYEFLRIHSKYDNYQYLWLKLLADALAAIDEIDNAGYYHDDDADHNMWVTKDQNGVAIAKLGDFEQIYEKHPSAVYIKQRSVNLLLQRFINDSPEEDVEGEIEIQDIIDLVSELPSLDSDKFTQLRKTIAKAMDELKVEERLVQIYAENESKNKAMLASPEAQKWIDYLEETISFEIASPLQDMRAYLSALIMGHQTQGIDFDELDESLDGPWGEPDVSTRDLPELSDEDIVVVGDHMRAKWDTERFGHFNQQVALAMRKINLNDFETTQHAFDRMLLLGGGTIEEKLLTLSAFLDDLINHIQHQKIHDFYEIENDNDLPIDLTAWVMITRRFIELLLSLPNEKNIAPLDFLGSSKKKRPSFTFRNLMLWKLKRVLDFRVLEFTLMDERGRKSYEGYRIPESWIQDGTQSIEYYLTRLFKEPLVRLDASGNPAKGKLSYFTDKQVHALLAEMVSMSDAKLLGMDLRSTWSHIGNQSIEEHENERLRNKGDHVDELFVHAPLRDFTLRNVQPLVANSSLSANEQIEMRTFPIFAEYDKAYEDADLWLEAWLTKVIPGLGEFLARNQHGESPDAVDVYDQAIQKQAERLGPDQRLKFEKIFGKNQAMLAPGKKGGIDLNPNNLELNTFGSEIEIELPVNIEEIRNLNIEGIMPNIINITPVTNLPLLLGFEESSPDYPVQTLTMR